jgi:hypothetical protein
MATKRKDIEDLVSKSMENRQIISTPAEEKERGRFITPRKEVVQIRFDPGDYETLQRIAYRKGTKAAALVRQIVKEYIKAEGGA